MARCKNCVVWWFGVCAGGYYCQHERETLIEEANDRAGQLGHQLGPFEDKVAEYAAWMARCTNCGQLAVISLDPRPGEQTLYGGAVSEPCPSPDRGLAADAGEGPAGGEDLSWLGSGAGSGSSSRSGG